ncbi:molybdate ABC transporter substrate-binding protein [uncultured Paraglaciecola sp.]|uniref:molybdate ABC transporter substrate-binding protein n=1 Tax=uncultured Paraglaciecola sp. TaxID=1765024 RepID=UPI00259A32F8|nr:molybdate ABC transporter substrate-binding protein [uncultured Paraglaciecola sp.]
MKLYSILFASILGIFVSFTTLAESAHLAVAANFRQCMLALVTELEKESNHRYVLSFGSSGKFYGQILHGAPFDMFFSADVAKPIAVSEAGLGVSKSRFTYAIGRLALLSSAKKSALALEQTLITGAFNKVSIANPKFAPYGIASLEVLDHLKRLEESKSKWVLGENIAQAYQFVDSGNVDLGFVALSQVMLKQKYAGSFWLIPDSWHLPIQQQAIILNKAKNNPAVLALINFIHSNKGKNILTSYGYLIAENNSV